MNLSFIISLNLFFCVSKLFMLDLNKSRVFLMKLLLLFSIFIWSCSSSDPVNVDEVLIEKMDGRFFKTPTKVYSGPGFKLYKNGKKKEEGKIKNGWKTETWNGYYENGSKKYVGAYEEGKEDGKWAGYYVGGEKKYEGLLSKEEMAQADDLGGYFRVPPDLRDLNYDKYLDKGETKFGDSEEYNSNNTIQYI